MDFPRLVYRCPGDCQRPGGTYAHQPVEDDAQLDAALADGWFETLPEAVEGIAVKKEAPADDTAPTREELEQKATELGITFSPNIGDKKLAEKIAAALKE